MPYSTQAATVLPRANPTAPSRTASSARSASDSGDSTLKSPKRSTLPLTTP